MPTDYACQAAADQATSGIAPVRAYLAPTPRPAPPPQDTDLSPTLRAYLGPGYPGQARGEEEGRGTPSALSRAHGAAVLVTLLDGLQADVTGVLVEWFSGLVAGLPYSLGLPGGALAPGAAPAPPPGGWEAVARVQTRAQEVLTVFVEGSGRAPVRAGELEWRLALVEDVFAGGLRRLNVPIEMSVQCAADVTEAAGSLFGIRTGAQD